MILLQSYSSPHPLSNDIGVYNVLKEHYPKMKVVYKKTDKVDTIYIKNILWLALKSNIISRKNDIILGWGGDLCLYAWFIGRILLKKRIYIGQNFIYRSSNLKGLKDGFRYKLYKQALKSNNFHMTVNAEPLKEYYAQMFNCSKDKFALVYDSMCLNEDEMNMKKHEGISHYVFCGGKAGRDVDTFVKVVRSLPNIKFKCVFKKSMVTHEMFDIPNLDVYTDIPKNQFYDILNNATVCCIPLNSKAPCGLYVMQHAVLMGIPIISTNTFSMRTIIPNDDCGFLCSMGDYKTIGERIELLMNDSNLRARVSTNAMNNFDKFAPNNVGTQLCDAIERFSVIC